jgi:hypothetical protein
VASLAEVFHDLVLRQSCARLAPLTAPCNRSAA